MIASAVGVYGARPMFALLVLTALLRPSAAVPALTPTGAQWVAVGAHVIAADRAPFGDPFTEQDLANGLHNCVLTDGEVDRLSTRDYLNCGHAAALLGFGWARPEIPIGVADLDWYDVTGWCESGGNPAVNTGNGYYGEVQWLPTTWRSAAPLFAPEWAGTRPDFVPRAYQRLVAVGWRDLAGRSQWPNCG